MELVLLKFVTIMLGSRLIIAAQNEQKGFIHLRNARFEFNLCLCRIIIYHE